MNVFALQHSQYPHLLQRVQPSVQTRCAALEGMGKIKRSGNNVDNVSKASDDYGNAFNMFFFMEC